MSECPNTARCDEAQTCVGRCGPKRFYSGPNPAPTGWCPKCKEPVAYHGSSERHSCGTELVAGDWCREATDESTHPDAQGKVTEAPVCDACGKHCDAPEYWPSMHPLTAALEG